MLIVKFSAAKEKLNDIIARGQKGEGGAQGGDQGGAGSAEFNGGHPAPSANELMNQNVAATAAIDGNVMVIL